MIRFKVVKGSHLLLILSVIVLLAVLSVILLQSAPQFSESQPQNAARIESPENIEEAKALAAFASSASAELQIRVVPDVPENTQSNAPSILIYHTHTHEAYAQDAVDPYVAIETWRTADHQHSVVRLGAVLAEGLSELGYRVTHDTTDHEQQTLDTAYVRSLETLEGYDEEFDMIIDLHRDAFTEGILPYLEHDEEQYAQFMMLVGRGDAYPEGEKPPYAENLRLAQKVTNALNDQISGICRNVTVKTGRYNQHIGKRALLVEVGHNQNTLKQALNSMPCLINAIDIAIKST